MYRALRIFIRLTLLGGVLAAGVVTALYFYLNPSLPATELLKDVRLQTPLRVYTRDRGLIAEFGEKRRIPVDIEQVPERVIQAFLAAEDDRFYQHPGVDYQGLLRAVFELVTTGEKKTGGSTITMQVARNFFLSREKTYLRKLNEILLALKIERELGKDEILELYLNKIYLGQRAYGIGAAAQVYYGISLEELNLAQTATIAGLPKAPSRDNPVSNPARAQERRRYVLGRMLKLGFIDNDQFEEARSVPLTARLHELQTEAEAPYAAEMVRQEMIDRYGEEAYTRGFDVYTTLNREHQAFANQALRDTLHDYDDRHGYRGPEGSVDPGDFAAALAARTEIGNLHPAVVTALDSDTITAEVRGVGTVVMDRKAWQWAKPHITTNHIGDAPKSPEQFLALGDIIRVAELEDGIWRLTQIPQIEGAFVSLLPGDGAITALVGGYDFHYSKFNRVTQAKRQPGSGFKPIIYSAALEKGYTAASLINDAPVVFTDPGLESTWRPENYSGRFFGPTRLRVALIKSRNLVSIRLLKSIGIGYAIDYAERFGLDTARLPHNLSLALGSGALTPLEMVGIYAVLANGGYRVTPYLIERIEDRAGQVLFQSDPAFVCPECLLPETTVTDDRSVAPLDEAPNLAPQILTPQNAYLMQTLLRDVARVGTARRTRQLGRNDLAGKTGTTNDLRDAWFNGFQPTLVASAWVGFDDFSSLGNAETGGRAALPMWMRFMASALRNVPEMPLQEPPGMVRVRIDPVTGKPAPAGQADAIFEVFRAEYAPRQPAREGRGKAADDERADGNGALEQLF